MHHLLGEVKKPALSAVLGDPPSAVCKERRAVQLGKDITVPTRNAQNVKAQAQAQKPNQLVGTSR